MPFPVVVKHLFRTQWVNGQLAKRKKEKKRHLVVAVLNYCAFILVILFLFFFYYHFFQIERELVVTTSEKIAEVGRIEKQLQLLGADHNTNNKKQSEPEAESNNSNMQAVGLVTQSAWGEDRRGVSGIWAFDKIQFNSIQYNNWKFLFFSKFLTGNCSWPTWRGYSRRSSYSRSTLPHWNDDQWIRPPCLGLRRTPSTGFLHGKSNLRSLIGSFKFDWIQLLISIWLIEQPMHVHYTGWQRQENNYVAMNFDGRVQHHPLHHQQPPPHMSNGGNFGATDHSLSFDSQHNGPSSLRDPFAPAINGNHSHLNQYEIQIDSSGVDRPRWASPLPMSMAY